MNRLPSRGAVSLAVLGLVCAPAGAGEIKPWFPADKPEADLKTRWRIVWGIENHAGGSEVLFIKEALPARPGRTGDQGARRLPTGGGLRAVQPKKDQRPVRGPADLRHLRCHLQSGQPRQNGPRPAVHRRRHDLRSGRPGGEVRAGGGGDPRRAGAVDEPGRDRAPRAGGDRVGGPQRRQLPVHHALRVPRRRLGRVPARGHRGEPVQQRRHRDVPHPHGVVAAERRAGRFDEDEGEHRRNEDRHSARVAGRRSGS